MSVECSIIIVTFNTRTHTLSCLRDLALRPSKYTYEVILVDNASSDGTMEAVAQEFPNTIIKRNSGNEGFSKGCNRGAAEAKGRYLCFLNSDTLATGPAIDTLIAWADQNPKCGIIGPEFRGEDRHLIQMSWGWDPVLFYELVQQYFAPYELRHSVFKRSLVNWLQRKTRSVQILCGACLIVRADAFKQVGGFDEQFELYFEDSDLCRRFRQAGWEVVFYPEAHIIHLLGRSTNESWGLTPLVYRQSQIYFYRKHAPSWTLPLLKAYLVYKWLRLRVKATRPNANEMRIQIYLSLFKDIILERRKIFLSGHYFDGTQVQPVGPNRSRGHK